MLGKALSARLGTDYLNAGAMWNVDVPLRPARLAAIGRMAASSFAEISNWGRDCLEIHAWDGVEQSLFNRLPVEGSL